MILKLILFFVILAQTYSKKGVEKNFSIQCLADIHCLMFNSEGAVCKNNTCVCEDDTECTIHKADARVKSTILGEECAEDENCNIQYAVCVDNFCVCPNERVSSVDGRKCLEVSEGLGKTCEEDIQCAKKIKGSKCSNGICVCDDFHNQEPNSEECFNKVGLGQPCNLQSQCTHIPYASCGTFHCECNAGFVQSASRLKCLPSATKPLDQCEESIQCKDLFPKGGICFHGKCECDSEHRNANKTMCPSRLKQVCKTNDECKSYKEDETMICHKSRCECAPSYVEERGYCNGAAVLQPTLLIVFSVVFVIYLKF